MIEVRVRIELDAVGRRERERPVGAAARTLVRFCRRTFARRGLEADPDRPPIVWVSEDHADYFIRDRRRYRIDAWAK